MALGPSPRQLPHVPQSVSLHWSHSPHRSTAVLSERLLGRLGSGMKVLCPGSSRSLLRSFLSTFAILAHSFHLTLFALCTFSGASSSDIFSSLWVELIPSKLFLGLPVSGSLGYSSFRFASSSLVAAVSDFRFSTLFSFVFCGEVWFRHLLYGGLF